MPQPEQTPLTAAELERSLRAVQPSVRVVLERRLRRALHELADDGDPVPINTHRPVWVDAARLRDWDVLPEVAAQDSAGRLLLVIDPDDLFPATLPPADVLRHYWRLLFQAAVADAIDVTDDEAAGRLAALGPAVPTEVRFVLTTDHLVPQDAPPAVLYRTFLAAFADLDRFAPSRLHWTFPSIPPADAVFEPVGGHPAIDRILAATRPEGVGPAAESGQVEGDDDPGDGPTPVGDGPARLQAEADRAAAVGNHVREAILRTRAAAVGHKHARLKTTKEARAALRDGLVSRLGAVLGWDAITRQAWVEGLMPLLAPAARGRWPRAARGLYDLQRIPVDLERGINTVDPIEWARTLGRRPLLRPLTRARAVILHRHLATAFKHLQRVPLVATDRDRLTALFHTELDRAEVAIRAECGPAITAVLDDAGLRPVNLPERVARDKVVAELLDRVCERGFVRFGDLRDAVARNGLKMPDLAGPGELARGDALLRADARLGEPLDGVYRRGEAYLRLIQRGTAVAFGTRAGRWLSKYVVFPFGGALLTVMFAQYLAAELGGLYRLLRRFVTGEPRFSDVLGGAVGGVAPAAALGHEHHLSAGPSVLAAAGLLGLLYLALLSLPAFRAAVWAVTRQIASILRFGLVGLPAAVWNLPAVRAVRRSRPARFVARRFGTALTVGLFVAAGLAVSGADVGTALVAMAAVVGVVAAVVATPVGQKLEDDANEAVSDGWRVVRRNLVPGLFGWVVWAFREVAGWVERTLYSVDEWFRFREGQSAGALWLRVVLAVVWFPVAYLFRFVFYLLFEPQVNPVKHFPVVTVSHKLIFPLTPQIAGLLGSEWLAGLIVTGTPGVFGFVAWELKENWRLYRASRPAGLTPVSLGYHGETVRGLLRPGFHSGTVPALYRKLRAAGRSADLTGSPPPVAKHLHGLHEVEHAVAGFLHRELIPLLWAADAWHGLTPAVGPVHVAVQSIEAELTVPELGGPNLRLALDHADGVITARVAEAGWRSRLSPIQERVLATALDGLFRLGAAGSPPGSPAGDWGLWVDFWKRHARGKEYTRRDSNPQPSVP